MDLTQIEENYYFNSLIANAVYFIKNHLLTDRDVLQQVSAAVLNTLKQMFQTSYQSLPKYQERIKQIGE